VVKIIPCISITPCIQYSKTKSIFRNICKPKGQASGEGSSSAGHAEINKVISVIGRYLDRVVINVIPCVCLF
jgi:hypothetical protein